MPSLIPGFEYDIFISYRQKDNKYDGWVTEFVDNLKKELEATFKEDISVYFDINPHDGLLESHEVGDSLKEKLKCLIFIPIISRTYCDPKAFAWEHEFLAFIEMASYDQFGLKVRLPGGNVASRVLPVRIYDLNKEDIKLCESALGGVLRGIEFIYKSAGVNRPLRANEDHAGDNLNKTYYRDQINKMAHSIQEIIQGLRTEPGLMPPDKVHKKEDTTETQKEEIRSARYKPVKLPRKKILTGIVAIAVLIVMVLAYPKIFKKEKFSNLKSSELLDKAIKVCDPYTSWGNYNGKVHLITVARDGYYLSDEIIEIQTKEGFYKCTAVYEGNVKIVRGIKDGQYFMTRNDSIISLKDTDTLDIDKMKEHHYCHFGLLMELKASKMILDENVKIMKFNGDDCLALNFTCDTNRIKTGYFKNTSWTIYLDRKNYIMKGWKADNILEQQEGYAIFRENLFINKINIPMIRTYYSTADNSFLAIDLFTKTN